MSEPTEVLVAVLGLAKTVAIELGHNYIGTEHVLIAMIRHQQNVGGHIFHDAEITENTILETIQPWRRE
jgi:ATP-dependent Clp protease ATP-binding subunit ClpC